MSVSTAARPGASPRSVAKAPPPAKLALPRLPAGMVARPRLDALVRQGVGGLATLVSAHAGTGKTTMLSAWARSVAGELPVAWVTLERRDNAGGQLAPAVAHALAASEPVASRGARKAPSLRDVLDRLELRTTPVVVVLDDFHELESRVALREVQTLLDHAPPHLRLVVATRAGTPAAADAAAPGR